MSLGLLLGELPGKEGGGLDESLHVHVTGIIGIEVPGESE